MATEIGAYGYIEVASRNQIADVSTFYQESRDLALYRRYTTDEEISLKVGRKTDTCLLQ